MQLVPTGIDDLAEDFANIVIGCKFPLNDLKQDLFVFSNGFYTELHGYNLRDVLYQPKDGRAKPVDLCLDAIQALRKSGKRIERGLIYPGLAAVSEIEFHKIVKDVTTKFPEIERVTFFGRRANEKIGWKKFIDQYNQDRRELKIPANGAALMNNYPTHVPYEVAIQINSDAYKSTGQGKSYGKTIEELLTGVYSLRENPQIPQTQCFNGIFYYFIRPNRQIATMETSRDITTELPDVKIMSQAEGQKVQKRIESTGRVLFEK